MSASTPSAHLVASAIRAWKDNRAADAIRDAQAAWDASMDSRAAALAD